MYYHYNYESFLVMQAERLEKSRQQQQAQDLLAELAAEKNPRDKAKRKRQ